jgi:hypothetical protein
MSLAALEHAEWTVVPGALELLETGEIDEQEPAWDRIALPAASRSLVDHADQTASESRWAALVRRLRGYERDAVIATDEPVWIPIVDVHMPPGGSATFTYARTRSAKQGLKLSILGAHFGGEASMTFQESLTLPATTLGKSLQVRMLLTATRYVSSGRPELVRVDVRQPESGSEYQVLDLPEPALPDLSDVLSWSVVHRERLRASRDSGEVAWGYSAGAQAKWEVGLDADVFSSGITLSAEAERAEEATVSFEMPYGKDYVFYLPAGANPLAPCCGVET